MASLTTTTRRLAKGLGVLTLVGIGTVALPGVAHAASEAEAVVGCADEDGTATATFTFSIQQNWVTSMWAEVIGVGETAKVSYATPGVDPPTAPPYPFDYTVGSATLELAPGTYEWYWWDTAIAPGGAGPNGPHGVGGVINGSPNILTVVACVVPTTAPAATTTTAVVETTTTVVPTTAPAATTTTAAAGTTTTAVVVAPPTSAAASTTAVVQTTAGASANTLPATGANNTPLIAAGVVFLLLGGLATAGAHRRPAAR